MRVNSYAPMFFRILFQHRAVSLVRFLYLTFCYMFLFSAFYRHPLRLSVLLSISRVCKIAVTPWRFGEPSMLNQFPV